MSTLKDMISSYQKAQVQFKNTQDRSLSSLRTTPREESSGITGVVTLKELEKIAKQSGVTIDFLKDNVEFRGGSIEGEEGSFLGKTLSFLADSLMVSVPQLLSKAKMNEQERKAIGELDQLIKDRSPGIRTLAEVAGGIASAAVTGPVGISKLAAKYGVKGAMAAGATYGAVGSAAYSEADQELTSAAIGGVVGAGLGGVLGVSVKQGAKLIQKFKGVDDNVGLVLTKLGGEDGDSLAKSLSKARESRLPEEVLDQSSLRKILSNKPSDLTPEEIKNLTFLSGEKDLESAMRRRVDGYYQAVFNKRGKGKSLEKKVEELGEKARIEGEQYMNNAYDKFRDVELLKEVKAFINPTGKDNSLKGVYSWFSGGRGRAQGIDTRNKTQLAPLIDDLSYDIIRVNEFKLAFTPTIQNLEARAGKAGLDATDIFDYLQGQAKIQRGLKLNSNEAAGLAKYQKMDDSQKQVITEYTQLMRDLKTSVEQTGLKIADFGAFYVPNKMKIADGLIDAFRTRLEKNSITTSLDETQFKNLMKVDPELIKGVEVVVGKKITSVTQFNVFLNKINNPSRDLIKRVSDASSLHKREGDIPDFLLDRNAFSAANRWITTVVDHAYKRDTLQAMDRISAQLRASGQLVDSQWIQRLIQDNQGSMRLSPLTKDMTPTAKEIFSLQRADMKFKLKARKWEREATNPFSKEIARDLYHLSESVGTMLQAFYTNVLGTSPRALVVNAMQPLQMTVPEFGYLGGMSTYLQAFKKIHSDSKVHGGVKNWLVARGYDGKKEADINWGLFKEGLSEGMKGMVGYKPPSEVKKGAVGGALDYSAHLLNKMGFLYGVLEQSNRAQIGAFGEVVAQNILKNDAKAVNYFMKQVDYGTKARLAPLLRAAQKGDKNAIDEFEKSMGAYFVSKTAFNYDKATASEFAREMHPLITQFTKWPIEVTTDFLGILSQKNVAGGDKAFKVVQKYIVPFAALYGLHQGAKLLEVDDSGVYQTFAGKGKMGLASSSPLMSLGGIFAGEMFRPPAMDIAQKMTGHVVTKGVDIFDEDYEIKNFFAPLAKAVPGEWIYRMGELLEWWGDN